MDGGPLAPARKGIPQTHTHRPPPSPPPPGSPRRFVTRRGGSPARAQQPSPRRPASLPPGTGAFSTHPPPPNASSQTLQLPPQERKGSPLSHGCRRSRGRLPLCDACWTGPFTRSSCPPRMSPLRGGEGGGRRKIPPTKAPLCKKPPTRSGRPGARRLRPLSPAVCSRRRVSFPGSLPPLRGQERRQPRRSPLGNASLLFPPRGGGGGGGGEGGEEGPAAPLRLGVHRPLQRGGEALQAAPRSLRQQSRQPLRIRRRATLWRASSRRRVCREDPFGSSGPSAAPLAFFRPGGVVGLSCLAGGTVHKGGPLWGSFSGLDRLPGRASQQSECMHWGRRRLGWAAKDGDTKGGGRGGREKAPLI